MNSLRAFARFGCLKSETASRLWAVAGSLWRWIESSSSYQWVSFKFNSFHSVPIYYVVVLNILIVDMVWVYIALEGGILECKIFVD